MKEIRCQNQKFEEWFASFGSRVSDQASRIETIHHAVSQQGSELVKLRSVENSVTAAVGKLQTDISTRLAGQIEQMSALFSEKKQRSS